MRRMDKQGLWLVRSMHTRCGEASGGCALHALDSVTGSPSHSTLHQGGSGVQARQRRHQACQRHSGKNRWRKRRTPPPTPHPAHPSSDSFRWLST